MRSACSRSPGTGTPPDPAGFGADQVPLLDVAGKAAGLPAYQLLGGRARDTVPVAWPIPVVSSRLACQSRVQPLDSDPLTCTTT